MRRDISTGVIRPGDRLMFPDVCERYSTSVGVAREALTALVSQGLVQSVAHQGYSVAPITVSDLKSLGEARMMIEPMVLMASISLGGNVMSAYHVMSRTQHFDADHRPTREWAVAHSAFHDELLTGCGNPVLLDITRRFSEKAELYRAWSDTLPLDDRDIDAEHKALMEAALAHQAEKAGELLRVHIERTINSILKHVDEG